MPALQRARASSPAHRCGEHPCRPRQDSCLESPSTLLWRRPRQERRPPLDQRPRGSSDGKNYDADFLKVFQHLLRRCFLKFQGCYYDYVGLFDLDIILVKIIGIMFKHLVREQGGPVNRIGLELHQYIVEFKGYWIEQPQQ